MENKISLSEVCSVTVRNAVQFLRKMSLQGRLFGCGGGGGSSEGCFFHFPDIESQNRTPCCAATLLRDSSKFLRATLRIYDV